MNNGMMKANADYSRQLTDAAFAVAETARMLTYATAHRMDGTISRAALNAARSDHEDAVARYNLLAIGINPDMGEKEIFRWATYMVRIKLHPRQVQTAIEYAKRNGWLPRKER